jgi:hypothetical protein
MSERFEWDYPPTMRQRRGRRRPEPVLEGEVLEPEPEQPPPRIRVEVVHRAHQPRQRQHVPPWLIALLIIAVLMWVSPFGAVIAIVMASVLIASHPTAAFVIGGMIALLIVFALRERWHGRPF